MVSLVASFIILCSPIMVFAMVSYWLWCHGFTGRLCLIVFLEMLAVKAHAVVYPEKLLKEKYRELIR